jgi:hypothetical protein
MNMPAEIDWDACKKPFPHYRTFHWLRAGQETRIMSVRMPVTVTAELTDQAQREGITVTWLVNRAVNFELHRLKALGPDPSASDLEYGRI